VSELRVRYADQRDLDFVNQDRYIPASVVARKIEVREVIVAEVFFRKELCVR
jgi:hypothetical protein